MALLQDAAFFGLGSVLAVMTGLFLLALFGSLR